MKMVRSPCCDKEHLSRGAWTKEEDELLSNHIKKHGIGNWRTLPKSAGLSRCGKSCRLRWMNYLRPDLKRGNFTEDEDELIIYLHSLIGNKWSIIAARLRGRTDNEIKNHWNTHIRRKLLSRGIDPKTHKPLSSSSSSSSANNNPKPPKRLSSEQQLEHTAMMRNNLKRVLSEEAAASQPQVNLELSLSMPSHQIEKPQNKGLLGNSSSSSSATCPRHNLGLQIGMSGKCDCVSTTNVSVVGTLQRFSMYYV